jgi:hypothetical protein
VRHGRSCAGRQNDYLLSRIIIPKDAQTERRVYGGREMLDFLKFCFQIISHEIVIRFFK